jgi:hypothetical protein
MKLTELTLSAKAQEPEVSLQRLHSGLNLISADRPEVLEAITRLFEQTFADSLHRSHEMLNSPAVRGSVQAEIDGGRYCVQRSNDGAFRLELTPLSNQTSNVGASSTLTKLLERNRFSAVSRGANPLEALNSAAAVLAARLPQHFYQQRFRSEREYLDWKALAEGRVRRLAEIRNERQALEVEKDRLLAELDSLNRDDQRQRERCDQEVSRLDSAIAAAERDVAQQRQVLAQFEAEILRLQSESRPTPQRVQTHPEWSRDLLIALYARIDDLDDQILNWSALLEDIHSERIRLRDEMVKWGETTIDRPEHPYFRAQSLISEINSTVDDADRIALQHVEDSSADARNAARKVSEHCDQIHTKLNELSDELGSQFKELRHRVAVNELKLLRGYHHRIGVHLEHLRKSLHEAIDRLRRYDEVGSVAIEKGLSEFLTLARQHGFLYARRTLHGPEPVLHQHELARIEPPLTDINRARLIQVTSQRDACVDELDRYVPLIRSLVEEREKWVAQRRLLGKTNDGSLRQRIDQLVERVARMVADEAELARQVELDRQQQPFVQHPLEQAASQFLSQLSGVPSRLSFWAADSNHSSQLAIWGTIGPGELLPLTSSSVHHQGLAALAVRLAIQMQDVQEGTALPALFDRWLEHSDEVTRQRFISILHQLGQRGLQSFCLSSEDVRNSGWLQTFSPSTFAEYRISTIATTRSVVTTSREAVPTPIVSPVSSNTVIAPAVVEMKLPEWTRHNLNSVFPAAETPHVYVDQTTEVHFESTPTVTEHTVLGDVDLMDHVHLRNLGLCGIHNIAGLLDLDPEALPDGLLSKGFTAAQIDRWQSQAWLLLCVPGLVPSESRLLVACGIVEPEQLDSTQTDQLLARINRYLISPDGQRMSYGAERFDRNRIQNWYSGLRATRQRWRREGGYSRRLRRQAINRSPSQTVGADSRRSESAESGRYFERTANRRYEAGNHFSSFPRAYIERPFEEDVDENDETFHGRDIERYSAASRLPSNTAHLPRERQDDTARKLRPSVIEEADSADDSIEPEANSGATTKFKFYLNLDDAIEAAPSIGPKTAERFIAIGIHSIRDFLGMTSELMAERIDFKRISADVIQTWQTQTRLVCQVPNLRGHDAQLLVACGITEAAQLAGMNPRKLLSLVGPFSDTKEGLKIIRSGKKPDLEEVTDWIEWAHHTRPLQAA